MSDFFRGVNTSYLIDKTFNFTNHVYFSGVVLIMCICVCVCFIKT